MKSIARRFILSFLLLAFAAVLAPKTAFAGDLDLYGAISWSRIGTKIDIRAGRVDNDRSGGISGSLRLQVWATTTPYYGGGISGYIMGTRNLGQLEGGYYYYDIAGHVSFRSPPPGIYYTTMTLEEYTGSGWIIVDYSTFDGTTSFGGVGNGTGTGSGDNGDLSLGGSVRWQSRGRTLTFNVDSVSNDRGGGISGSLRLRLWATSSPYYGGSIYGYVLGTARLGRLSGGYYFPNVRRNAAFRRPPSGRFYTTVTLEEYTTGGWAIVDYVTFDGSTRF